MAEEYTIEVEHGERRYNAAVRADERTDELLLKSLDYFDHDPGEKGNWTLARVGVEDGEKSRLVLGDPVSEQLENGERVRLIPRDADTQEPSTGSY